MHAMSIDFICYVITNYDFGQRIKLFNITRLNEREWASGAAHAGGYQVAAQVEVELFDECLAGAIHVGARVQPFACPRTPGASR